MDVKLDSGIDGLDFSEDSHLLFLSYDIAISQRGFYTTQHEENQTCLKTSGPQQSLSSKYQETCMALFLSSINTQSFFEMCLCVQLLQARPQLKII